MVAASASTQRRAIASLTWRAGLNMRVAMSIQTSLLKLAAQETLLARGGTHYPMSPEEMAMHLELFGVSGA